MPRRKIRLQSDNLVQGISQQVETRQTLNHCKDRQNIVPSIIHGNTKRPAARFTTRLDTPADTDMAEHFYERDSQESYLIINTGSAIQVFDRNTNTERNVSAPNGYGYLSSPNTPSEDFCFLTLGDYTLVCNKTRTVALSAEKTATQRHQTLLYVTQGDYATTYTVSVDDTHTVSVTTSDTTQAETATTFIVQALKTALMAELPADTFTITGDGSVLLIERTDKADFALTATDSINNDAIRAVKGTIQRFVDLPARAPDGYFVKVTQSAGVDVDDYYVKFQADDPSSPESAGVWVETIGADLQYAFDEETMPHFLVREADGSFTFRKGDWAERTAGDAATVPAPSFVGKPINWMYFFENRLGFLAGSNKVESRASSYFNFWRQSARTKLDSDPVDLAATTSAALELHYAIPFDQKLVVFSDNTQLICRGGNIYSPSTASMEVGSEYEMDPRTAPVSVGKSVFFTVRQGRYSAVMEMQGAEGDADKLYAVEITEHIPHLLPEGRFKLIASAKSKALLLYQPGSPTVWAYNWHWADRVRVIASWHRYMLSDGVPVWGGVFSENELQLLTKHGTTQVIVALTFDENGQFLNTVDDSHLDFRMEGKISDTAGDTLVKVPLSLKNPIVLGVRADGSIAELQNLRYDITEENALTQGTDPRQSFKVPGQFVRVVVGEVFDALHHFSQPYPVRFGPRGEKIADLTDRFQLTKLLLTLTDTGHFSVTIKKPNRGDRVEHFTGIGLGNIPSTVNGTPVSSGSFKVSLRGQTEEMDIKLLSRTWMPLCLTAAEWSGTLIRKL